MGLVSSYRDLSNPEAIHFPGSFAARTFLIVMILLCGGAVIGVWLTSSGARALLETLPLLLMLALVGRAWPRRITTDQYGVQRANLLGLRSVSIHWDELAPLQMRRELRFASNSLLDAKTVVLRDTQGTKRIVHTPRHADRDRFVNELRKHGAALS